MFKTKKARYEEKIAYLENLLAQKAEEYKEMCKDRNSLFNKNQQLHRNIMELEELLDFDVLETIAGLKDENKRAWGIVYANKFKKRGWTK